MRQMLKGLVLMLLFCQCKKEPPEYTLLGPTESDRVVLIEEFSGARCPNCPQGAQELENLKAIHGSNLVIVSIHAGDFAFTYPDSKFDFTTEGGDQLLDLLGNPLGYPSAVINRIEDDGGSYQVFSSKWASIVSEELQKPVRLTISTDLQYDTLTRVMEADITVLPLEDFEESLRITVLIKEDEIIDPQADRAESSGVVPDYHHRNVLRSMLTAPQGDDLTGLEAFVPVIRHFSFRLPPEEGWWRDSNCTLVSFVSYEDPAIEVLQANEEPLRQP